MVSAIGPWKAGHVRGRLPEIGKSFASLAIAADLFTGRALPFDQELEAPLRSLIISHEDNPADTIKPRLKLLGADMNMIAVPHRDSQPSLDPSYIAQVLTEWAAAFVVALSQALERNSGPNSSCKSPLLVLKRPERA